MAILEKTLKNKAELFDFIAEHFKTIHLTLNQQNITLHQQDFKDEDALYEYLLNLLHPKVNTDLIDD